LWNLELGDFTNFMELPEKHKLPEKLELSNKRGLEFT